MKTLIVGVGIAGLSTAWALVKRGHDVTLLEQSSSIPSPLAASGDQHRIIRRAYAGADGYARTIGEAFEAWDELWDDLGVRHQADCGVLVISQRPDDQAAAFKAGLERGGYPFALFDAAEAARRYPFLDQAAIDYAFLSPEGGALFCQRIARDLVAWLTRNGATLRTGAAVTALDAEAGRVTLESGETLTAERVVVTAGAWVLKLFPELAGTLTTYRTYVAYLEPPPDLKAAWKSAPVLLDIGGSADVYAIPPLDGTGLKLGSGLVKSRGGPDERRTPEPGEGERLRDLFAPPVARIAEYSVSRVVTCAYTFTADERFACHAKDKALVVSACSGHGYKFGAAIGRRVAAAVESGDIDLLARWLAAEESVVA